MLKQILTIFLSCSLIGSSYAHHEKKNDENKVELAAYKKEVVRTFVDAVHDCKWWINAAKVTYVLGGALAVSYLGGLLSSKVLGLGFLGFYLSNCVSMANAEWAKWNAEYQFSQLEMLGVEDDPSG